jgi:hypothetical protein
LIEVFKAPAEEIRPAAESAATNRWTRPFSDKEIVFSSVLVVGLCATLVALLSHYPYYSCCFDQISAAIRHWDFRGLDPSQPKEFWGYPYLTALVAEITRLPDKYAMVVVSASMFVLANYLCGRLWGTTVAAWFMVVSWWWLDGAAEGLTEPLFMAFVFGSLLAVRKEKWLLAASLASGATVVRPVGIFALVAIGIVLLKRREFRRFGMTSAIALFAGVLYAIPLMQIYGDPLANVRGYHTHDWSGSAPVTIPFGALMTGARTALVTLHSEHGRRLIGLFGLQLLIAGWVVLVLAATIHMAADKRFWRYATEYPTEAILAGVYAVFLFSYNAPSAVWEFFPRFAIPLLPFLLLFLRDRLPKDRRLLCGVLLLNVALTILPKLPIIHQYQ